MSCDHVRGTVVIDGTTTAMAGARVVLGVARGGGFDGALTCVSDALGGFSFDLRQLPSGRTSLYHDIRVFDADDVQLEIHGDVRWPRGQDPGPLRLCATPASDCPPPDESLPQDMPPSTGVWGVVRHKDGSPIIATVELWDTSASGETLVGTTTSAGDGWYAIPVAVGTAAVVKAKHTGTSALLAISPAHFSPGPNPLRIDLDVCSDEFRRSTEWSRIEAAGNPVLSPLTADQATMRQLAFISGSTGWAFNQVATWSLAHRLALTLSADAESLYGLLRMGFPRTTQGMAAKPASTVGPALSKAVLRNIIAASKADAANVASVTSALRSALQTQLNSTRDTSIGEILRASGVLSPSQISDFIDAWVAHIGDEPTFWADLPTTKPTSFGGAGGPAAVAEAQRLLTLGAIALSFAPIVEQILAVILSSPASAVASLTSAQWAAIVAGLASLPAGLPDTVPDQAAYLAELLAEHAERFFPSETAREQLVVGIGTGHVLEPAKDFLTANPSFRIADSRVDSFSGTAGEKAAAKRAQRLYRVAPGVGRAAAITTLAEQGFDSAQSVAAMTKGRFLELQEARAAASKSALDLETATQVVRNAQWLQSLSTSLYMAGHAAESGDYAFGPEAASPPSTGTDPDWAGVYASGADCSCEQCRSVHGPAAYLFDLLYWLEVRPVSHPADPDAPDSLLDRLTERRPDLVEIKLNCENAETPLPYVDLVLEALESAVANGGDVGADAGNQTTMDAADLLAAPEHRNEDAYTTSGASKKLDEDTAAISLPFHRPLEEARAFLQHIQASRLAILAAYEDLPSIDVDDLAEEALGLFAERVATITTGVSGTEGDFWPVATASLTNVTTFLRASGLSWPETLNVLHARYANPRTWDGAVWTYDLMVAATDPCDLSTFTIVQTSGGAAPTDNQWTRVRQFVRLLAATGWTPRRLDLVLHAIDDSYAGEWLDTAANWLRPIADVHLLAAETGMAAEVIATTSASAIDTYPDLDGQPSLYETVFLSPAVLGVDDPARASFALNAQGTEIAVSVALSAVQEAVAGALGVNQEELQRLVDAVLPVSAGLTIANLTTLYAWVQIGRLTGLSPTDAVAFSDLASLNPRSVGAGLADLRDLRSLANRLSAAGWSVSELRYVLTSTVVPEAAPTGAFLQQTLGRIRDAATKATTHLTEDSTEASARQAALEAAADALGLPPEALARTRSHTWSGLPTLAVNTSFHVVEQGELTISAESTAAPAGTSILVPIGTSVAPKGGGSAASLGESRPMTMQASATASVTALVLPPGTPWTVSASGADQVDAGTAVEASQVELPAGTPVADQEDGTEWTLTSATTVQVLTPRLAFTTSAAHEGTIAFASSPPNPDFVRRFLRDEFVGSAGPVDDPYGDLIDGGVFADDFSWVRALYKVSLIASKLDLEASEWRWWLDETASASWDLALASGTSGSSAPSYSFAQLVRLFDLFGLQADLRDGEPSFASILELGSAIPGGGSAEVDAFAAALAERSGWPADQITSVAGQTGSSPVDVPGLEALFDRMGLVRRTGVSPAALLGWAVPATDVTSSMSAAVVDAARGRHAGEESWRSAARPVRDVLRKRQRDALVAWLMAHPPTGVTFDTPDDLYEHYLIDVSMNPELLTSRIVQASATVQLFIHRLMLGLERESPSGAMIFEPNGEDREQWEWVRTYRVWEAGRKVFLYPENWIEPELRDDKTPFFRKLEQELSEGDITEERVEKVAIGYLERLSDVANIEVLAFHHQVEALDAVGGDDIDVLHVVGRTRATPSTYWYRRLENDSRWTPWEEVDCGVEGQHLVLTTAGRHVTLVWAVIEEAADLSNAGTALQARVYVSERRNGAWTPPRVSPPVPAGDVEAATRLTVYQASGGSGPRVRIEQDLDACLVGADGGPLYPDGYESGCGAVDVRAELYLDACTGMFAPASPPATLLPRRDAGVGLGWSASQYWFDIANRALSVYDPDVAPATEALTVWWQEAEDGMPKDGAVRLPAPLLATAGMAGVVVPSWTHDFVSQSSFFTQQPGRSWFVRVESTGNLPPAGDHAVSQVMSLSRGVYAPGDPENNNPEPIEDLAPLTHDYLRLDSDLVVSGMTDWLGRFDMLNAGDQPAAPPALYRFSIFYHPLCCAFTDAVNRGGIFALLDPVPSGPETRLASGSLRRQAAIGTFDFETNLTPNPVLTEYSRAIEDIDFSEDGAYSQYNWELFFHMPIFVARRLSDGGHHDQAMKFLHAVFDPRVGDDDVPSASPWTGPARWWKVAPLMQAVSKPVTDWIEFVGGDADAMAAFDRQVDAWREDPFNPHLIARLRPGTYQRAVVMQYVDNLIAWGDALFGQDTLETLNEATQLYVFALQVLGQRPERPKSSAPAAAKTFAEAQSDAVVDRFRNVVFENSYTGEVSAPVGGSAVVTLNGSVAFPYFCVPRNPELQSYWDTLEDRLFKIRNGMNIDGVVRSLPLFQPPIDPAQLVRAAAAGLDISSVVAGLTAPRPRHRFAALLARAQRLASGVGSLGQALLSALEKKDAEALAKMRQGHEVQMLDLAVETRKLQLDEAKEALAGVLLSRATVEIRRSYYEALMDAGWLAEEANALSLSTSADLAQVMSGVYSTIGSIAGLFPDVSGPVPPKVETGGQQASRVMSAYSAIYSTLASAARAQAAFLTTTGGYRRREQEWSQQLALAESELAQVDKQIVAAEIRVEIAERELANSREQIKHSKQVQAFYEKKFTNQDLYAWMSSQLTALHFQQYQLAVAAARKAEASFNYERARSDEFIGAAHYDRGRQGLLAGERLVADLDRMEAAHYEHYPREHELVKHISVRRLDPLALVRLRATGECFIDLPEAIFDLDCPGHYLRRLQHVSVTIACVSGSNANVNARLTLHASKVRRTSTGELELEATREYPSVTTSTGVEDAGLPISGGGGGADQRFLPFEGRGAVSLWHLAFSNQEYRQFDWDSVTDVVLHVRYMARDGGASVRTSTLTALPAALDALRGGFKDAVGTEKTSEHAVVAISARRDQPDDWYAAQQAGSSDMTFNVGNSFLPYFATGKVDAVAKVHVVCVGGTGAPTGVTVTGPGGTPAGQSVTLTEWPSSGSQARHGETTSSWHTSWPDTVALSALTDGAAVSMADLDDILLVLEFSVS